MKIAAAALILSCLIIAPFKAYSAEIGGMAPSFSLKDITGNTVTFESLKGKVVFLDFWGTWCGPCKEEFPELDALYKKYGKDGFEVVGISVDKSESNVAEYLKKRPVSFTILTNTKGDVAEAYGIPGMPTGFIIGKDGVIRYRHVGFSKAFLPVYEKEIVELLKKP
ncbi:MAG: TlpA disulfide reductase family protein [Deltaproteobacteria bacterium]|nr:TlpA disulfide reductase family protein [Deltaproteobacteria bacterium]